MHDFHSNSFENKHDIIQARSVMLSLSTHGGEGLIGLKALNGNKYRPEENYTVSHNVQGGSRERTIGKRKLDCMLTNKTWRVNTAKRRALLSFKCALLVKLTTNGNGVSGQWADSTLRTVNQTDQNKNRCSAWELQFQQRTVLEASISTCFYSMFIISLLISIC